MLSELKLGDKWTFTCLLVQYA